MSLDESAVSGLVLVVEDDAQMQKFLRISLEASGFQVIETRLGQDALKRAALERPNIIILDLGLPDLDGHVVIARLREWTHTPIIVLSVRLSEREKVKALDAGANDYVVKPFGVLELLARVRAALRLAERAQQPDETVVRTGALEIDLAARMVRLEGEPLHLTKKEFELLKTLAQSAGRVLTHTQLLNAVWGPSHVEQFQYLRFHIAQLRKKLCDDPEKPRYIETESGVGYRLSLDQ
jgi:two-component system KDP operon response regulator KdpE